MSRRQKLVAKALCMTAAAAPALAAEGAAGAAEGLRYDTMFWKGFNFAVLIAVLVKFLAKPVRDFFTSRRAQIERELADALAGREEALSKLREIEAKLARADAESAELCAKAESDAKAERERILASASEEAERMRTMAKEEIRRATDLARAELSAHAATLATERATEILKGAIDDADRHRLFSDYLRAMKGRLPS